ncbi:hypothetical protein F4561_004151 [Lipingzhangella halophila]|uniref:Uncharacterized protein n=1 Tax=Lipingzhangella halophila TaxID=1783352 RepID=A0A7W7W413_9ACTN|nr:hypothetical protein [Lipingzhangella halophila]MBB4933331.1 hypothetical protein [Lipingzhangella halophila]
MTTSIPGRPAAAQSAHQVTLALDPMTHAELERAAGHRDVASYLYILAGRYARWSELREWVSQLETAYGALPPEALERLYRQMLGMPPRMSGGTGSLTVTLDAEEFRALAERAGERPLASYVREVLVDLLTARHQPDSADVGAG